MGCGTEVVLRSIPCVHGMIYIICRVVNFVRKITKRMIKGCKHFLNGKQYTIFMRFSTQNPLIVVLSISYTVPEIILKKTEKVTSLTAYKYLRQIIVLFLVSHCIKFYNIHRVYYVTHQFSNLVRIALRATFIWCYSSAESQHMPPTIELEFISIQVQHICNDCKMEHSCKSHLDSCCHVCGFFVPRKQRQNISPAMWEGCKIYFQIKPKNGEKGWIRNSWCTTCTIKLRSVHRMIVCSFLSTFDRKRNVRVFSTHIENWNV